MDNIGGIGKCFAYQIHSNRRETKNEDADCQWFVSVQHICTEGREHWSTRAHYLYTMSGLQSRKSDTPTPGIIWIQSDAIPARSMYVQL